MDELAHQLNIDPLEFRLRNALDVGDITATGHRLTESVGVRGTLEAVREALALQALPSPAHGKRVGVGVATSYKNVGLGPGLDDEAGSIAELDAVGRVIVRVGCIDMGQGQNTTMAQIAAQTLQVPYSRIVVVSGDTASCPDSFMTTASRATLIQGNAVVRAVTQLRDALLDYAVREFALSAAQTQLVDGRIVDTSSNREVSLAELGRRAADQKVDLSAEAYWKTPTCYSNLIVDEKLLTEDPEKFRLHAAYCFCTQAAVVEVDDDSGEVRVLKVIAAQDVGKPIHPRNIEGQIEGGVVMGMGYGLYEEFVVDNGYVVTDTLRKIGVPRFTQAPEISTLIVEDPHSLGPFGAKGMSELPVTPTAPAIANAIYNAVGVRVRHLPIRPKDVLAAL
jgi:CO/xanthine dehydrogenase Mo-binding subunit